MLRQDGFADLAVQSELGGGYVRTLLAERKDHAQRRLDGRADRVEEGIVGRCDDRYVEVEIGVDQRALVSRLAAHACDRLANATTVLGVAMQGSELARIRLEAMT